MCLFFVPESPHWLIAKQRYTDAKEALAWLRGWLPVDQVQAEYHELEQQIRNTAPPPRLVLKLYAQKNFLWPYGVVCFAFFLGHFSGMTTLQTYAVTIFSTLQAPIDKYHATIFLGVAEVTGCIISAFLVHYVGKRRMNFFSLAGSGVAFFVVATIAHLHEIRYIHIKDGGNPMEANTWLPTALLILAAFFTHSGIRILPWMLIGEVFSPQTRSTASGLSGAASYIFGFISNKIFLKTVETITLPGTFWFYAAMSFLGIVVLYVILPETEGKTLFEITEHFASRNQLDNNVYRARKHDTRSGQVNQAFNSENESKF